jgi:thymidine phosphorylase
LPAAPVVREVTAPRSGFVRGLEAIRIGNAAVHLGAGRRTKEDDIDHAVGIVCRLKRGAEAAAGDVLAEVHARTEASAEEAVRDVLGAYELADKAPAEREVLLEVVG